MCITVSGNRLAYILDAGSPAAILLEAKFLVNSTISDSSKGARFMSAILTDCFLATPMDGEGIHESTSQIFPRGYKKTV